MISWFQEASLFFCLYNVYTPPNTCDILHRQATVRPRWGLADYGSADFSGWHHHKLGLSSYLVWVGVKFSNAKEEELLINDASQIGSKKFDFSIE